jgi:hypothetical protein
VLALIGTVIAALLSASFIPDFLVNPAINVEVIGSELTAPRMIITNDGSEPANNVHLFIAGYNKGQNLGDWTIKSVTNDFSTTSVFLVQPKSESEPEPKVLEIDKRVCLNKEPECFSNEPISILDIHIPKLVQGLGSQVIIIPSLESRIANYGVVVSFDEGSGIVSDNPNYIRTLSYYFTYSVLFKTEGIAILMALMASALLVPILFFVRFISRKRVRKRIINELLENIENNRQKIVRDGYTTSEYFNNWRGPELRYIITNPKDYAIIDDLHTKIDKRNGEIDSLPEYDKKEINSECFNLMEKALNIEWDNYL